MSKNSTRIQNAKTQMTNKACPWKIENFLFYNLNVHFLSNLQRQINFQLVDRCD